MQILLVVPKYTPVPFSRYEFPMGLAYISAVLKRAGHHVKALNLNDYYGPLHLNNWSALEMLLSRWMVEQEYQLVMTGGLSPFFDMIQQVFSAARRIKPDILSVVGGGVVSSEPLAVMREIGADVGVVGEGEETVVELVAELEGARNLADIRGIVYWNGEGLLVQTPARPPIADIDALPCPDYEGFNVDRYLERQLPHDLFGFFRRETPRLMPILASRSCPFKCSFCFHPVGDKYRLRSLDSVFEEIEYLIEHYGINTLTVMDELFGFNKKYFAEFCRRIKRYNLDFVVQIHVSQANEDSIRLLKEAGCVFISYGIESANNDVLKSMRKNSNVGQIERALRLTYEAGIQIQGNLIFGEKAETIETARESMAWWQENLRYQINLSLMVPYPGSELWNLAVERGIIADKIDFIRQDCGKLWRLNLTRMTDLDFDYVFSSFRYLDHFYRVPAKVISCRQEGVNPLKGRLYALSIECPHCGKVVEYRRMHCRSDVEPPFHRVRLGCCQCNQRFDILPFPVEEKLHRFLAAQPTSRFALLRENDCCLNLLRFSPALRKQVTCVVDDLALYGQREIEGCPVIPLSNNIRQIAEMADAVLLTAEPTDQCHFCYMPDLGPQGLATELAKYGVRVVSVSKLLAPVDLESEKGCRAYIQEAFEAADRAVGSGALDEAFNTYLLVLQKFPWMPQGHRCLAEVALALGEHEIALDALSTAGFLEAEDVNTHVRLGLLLSRLEHHVSARNHFSRALAIQPDHWEAFFNLALSALGTADHEGLLKLAQSHLSLLHLNEPIVQTGLLALHDIIGQMLSRRPANARVLATTMSLLARAVADEQRSAQTPPCPERS